MNWFTRKKVIFFSFIGVVGFLILIPKEILFSICDAHNTACINSIGYLFLIFMIGITIFIPSLILLFLKQEIFDSWRKTLFIYLFIYLFIIIITPWYAGDSFFHIQKDLIAAGFSVFYFIFSVVFITYKSLKKE